MSATSFQRRRRELAKQREAERLQAAEETNEKSTKATSSTKRGANK